MAKRKWVKHCLRTNCAAPEDIQLTGNVKVAKIYSNLLYKREKEPELYDAIKAVAPEWWDDETRMILNKDLVAHRHKAAIRDTRGFYGWVIIHRVGA